MSRRNVLFLTHRVPFPPDKGDKIRTFHQLDYLSTRHNVYCACFVDRPEDQVHAIALQRWCAEVAAFSWTAPRAAVRAARSFLAGRSLTCGAYRDDRMFNQLAAWAETVDFDLVTAFSACMAPYALAVPARRRVLDLCDADSRKWEEYGRARGSLTGAGFRIEARRLAAYERQCLERFDATLVITPRERAALDAYGRNRKLFVVPNGVHMPYSTIAPPSSRGPVVSFVGRMDYRPNADGVVDFAECCWPLIREAVPSARLLVVGADPRRAVSNLSKLPGIRATGSVADVRPYLRASRVFVAPLGLARGLPNKVLEAMSMSRPVVATSQVARALAGFLARQASPLDGAVEAPKRAVAPLWVANDAERFADAVVRLLGDDGLCDELGRLGQAFVRERFNWNKVLTRYEKILFGEIRQQPAPRPLERTNRVARRPSGMLHVR